TGAVRPPGVPVSRAVELHEPGGAAEDGLAPVHAGAHTSDGLALEDLEAAVGGAVLVAVKEGGQDRGESQHADPGEARAPAQQAARGWAGGRAARELQLTCRRSSQPRP